LNSNIEIVAAAFEIRDEIRAVLVYAAVPDRWCIDREEMNVATESTRAKISAIAAQLEACDRELRSLPESPTAFQARKRLEETSGLLRVLHAKTPDVQPRHRASKRSID
jgi:hypothetical protein